MDQLNARAEPLRQTVASSFEPLDVIETSYQRIEREPHRNCWIYVRPREEAREECRKLMARARAGENLPLLVVGGGCGRIKGGRHLVYPDKPSQANLLVTLMDKLDVPVERLGGSTGKLPLDTLSGV